MTALTLLGGLVMALLLYTYAGYPLAVALWARLRPRPVNARREHQPSVSILLSVVNGAEHLPAKLESLFALDYPSERLEILICSDGSTDETLSIAERAARRDPRVFVASNPHRLGKPTSLNRLLGHARHDVLVLTDVRQPLSTDAVSELVAPLADPSVGCVSGNLVLDGETGAGAYWRYERFIRGSEARLGRMVGVSGALYAVRRGDFPRLPPNVILDDMYVPLHVASKGKSVVLADLARAYDHAQDDEREFTRKVRTLAGNFQLLRLMPELLSPRSPTWLPLVSHKLLRLLCPWALLLLLGVSVALPVPLWRVLLGAQLAFYLLALLGPRAGRLGALARTFVVLNAAAMVGLWRYARGRQLVTW